MIIPLDMVEQEQLGRLSLKNESNRKGDKRARLLEEQASVRREGGLATLLESLIYGTENMVKGVSMANPVTLPGNVAVAADKALGLVPKDTPMPFPPGDVARYAETGEPILEVPKLDPGAVGAALARLGYSGRASKVAAELVAGAEQSVADLGDFFLSEPGFSLPFAKAAPKVAKRALSLGFGTDMTARLPETAEQAGEASVGGGAEAVRQGLNLAGQTLFPASIASGFVIPELRYEASRLQDIKQTRPKIAMAKGERGLQVAAAQERAAQRPNEAGAIFPERKKSLTPDAPLMLRSKQEFGFNPETPVDATQIGNRLKNKLTPGEYLALEAAGLGDFLKGKKTPEEVAKWVEENGPKVEVKKLWATASSEKAQKLAEMEHELDIIQPDWRRRVGDLNLPKDVFNKIKQYREFRLSSEGEASSDSATARYTMVNPKPLKLMEGAVDLLVRIPLKEGPSVPDQSLPGQQRGVQKLENDRERGLKFKSSHYPFEGNNLVAHVRGNMETLPNGKKVFHVFEVQSDWETEQGQSAHPLLKHYERLAIKAAIDHAREQGVDGVAISDSGTVALTEGHEQAIAIAKDADGQDWPRSSSNFQSLVTKFPDPTGGDMKGELIGGGRFHIEEGKEGPYEVSVIQIDKLPFLEGDKLHYDQTLPKIAEELTGEKGERVYFGRHQNAQGRVSILEDDGVTPKTTISTRYYPIAKAPTAFSLFGSDKAGKGLQVKAAQERAQERRGETGSLFPHGDEGKRPSPFKQSKVGGLWYHLTRKSFEGEVDPEKASREGLASLFGAHFGTREQIENLADPIVGFLSGTRVGRYFLDVKNPYFVSDSEANHAYVLAQKMFEDKLITESELESIPRKRVITVESKGMVDEHANFLKKRLEERGYDSLIYENEFEGGGDSIVPFKKAQIRNELEKGAQDAGRIRNDERSLRSDEGQEGQAEVFDEGRKTDGGNDVERQASGESKSVGAREEGTTGLRVQPGTLAGEGGFVRLPQRMRAKTTQPLNGRDVLPDVKTQAEANRTYSEKFSVEGTETPVLGRVGKKAYELVGQTLGRVMGGKARVKTPYDESIAAWYVNKHGVAPARAAALGARIKNEVNDAFSYGKVGEAVPGAPGRRYEKGDLAVMPTRKGLSLKTSDVFEEMRRDPNAYRFTAEQQRVWQNILIPVLDRMTELVRQHDLVTPLDPYFMRTVESLATKKPVTRGGTTVGAKRGFQKQRKFDSELEGWQHGDVYVQDVEARLIQGVSNLYQTIADKQLATDPVLGGLTRAQKAAQLRRQYPNLSPSQRRKRLTAIQQSGSVHSPAFFGKIYNKDVAEALNREFTAEQNRLRKLLVSVNSVTKALELGFDFGVGQVQLLPTAFNRPDIWAKAQGQAMQAFFSSDAFPIYVRQNWQYIKELGDAGSSVGRLEEYMSGMGSRSPLGRIPVVGSASRAFGRHFQTALDVAKVELYKAWRDVTPEAERMKMIQSIEATLLSGRMESGMVTHSRSLLERVMFLAPSYYRGAVHFIGALGESGVSGQITRRAMGRFIFGSVVLYYGVGRMLDMDHEELVKRMVPGKPNFMNWRVQIDEGRPLEVGLGGILASFLGLGANVIAFARQHPREWNTLSDEKNPFTRWYRSHSGPIISWSWNAFTGKDFLSREESITGSLKNVLPLAGQPLLEEGRMKKEAPLRMLGFSTKPAKSPTSQEVANKMFGRGVQIEGLTISQRRSLTKSVEEQRYPQTAEEKKLSAERALGYQLERTENLERVMTPESKAFLKENKLSLPGYSVAQTFKGQRVPFTEAEKEWFFNEVAAQYELAFSRLQEQEDFSGLKQSAKELRLQRVLEGARKIAVGRLNKARREGTVVP